MHFSLKPGFYPPPGPVPQPVSLPPPGPVPQPGLFLPTGIVYHSRDGFTTAGTGYLSRDGFTTAGMVFTTAGTGFTTAGMVFTRNGGFTRNSGKFGGFTRNSGKFGGFTGKHWCLPEMVVLPESSGIYRKWWFFYPEQWKTVGQAKGSRGSGTCTVRPGMSRGAVYTQTVVFPSTPWALISGFLTF